MANYIDRDKVLEAILDLPPKMDEQGYGWLGRMGVWQMLSDFPSADVAPVVHGKWINSVAFHKVCSECNCVIEDPAFNEIFFGCGRLNYCPNCGAKMDLLN